MASFNYSTRQMTVKIVYYGPGLGGKTTNLQYIYDHTTRDSRGEMVSLETQSDRTLFFDLLPLEVGSIAGFNTRIQLYTVPGQVFYNTTRKLVLKGVDGIVFVADSQRPMVSANLESFRNLEANLAELGILIGAVPLVIQYNKRDLNDLCPIDELDQALNPQGVPSVEASAIAGGGVFETLRAITRVTLVALKKQLEEGLAHRSATEGAAAASKHAGVSEEVVDTAGALLAAAAADTAAAAAADTAAATAGSTHLGSRPPASSGNGHEESESRNLVLSLRRADFERARRLLLNLQVEDGNREIVHEVHDVHLDLDEPRNRDEMLLRLSIRLSSEE